MIRLRRRPARAKRSPYCRAVRVRHDGAKGEAGM